MFRFRLLLSILILLAVAGCGGAPPPSFSYTAVATSATTVRVSFSTDVAAGAEVAGNYALSGPAGEAVPVAAAFQLDGSTVLLGTSAAISGSSYTLIVSGVQAQTQGALATAQSKFSGSTEMAPIMASAIALDPTHILVTFADPKNGTTAEMSDGALDPRFYSIRAADSGASAPQVLAIVPNGIEFAQGSRGGLDRSRVVIETEPQANREYLVAATNLVTRAGDKLLDPSLNSATFFGIPPEDSIGPSVTKAVAVSNTAVLVDFSEPVEGANSPDRYAISSSEGDLAVTAVQYTSPYQTQVLLTTAPQKSEEITYTLVASGIWDMQGNPMAVAGSSKEFTGISKFGPIDGDTTPPRVFGANSTSNTTVLVTFSEPVADGPNSSDNPDHFTITASALDGNGLATQSILKVLGAQRDASDPTKVRLTTMQQSELEYTLVVTGVTDLAGNEIAPPDRENPYATTFMGTGTSGAPIDSDCDGLSDAAEQAGWIVTVTDVAGGTSQVEVTSDPGEPGLAPSCAEDDSVNLASRDTDQDGIGDKDELVYGTHPRSADTDGDDLTDFEELNWIYSEPTDKDSDGDGLPDGLEYNFFGTSPIRDDTDGDQLLDDLEVTSDNRDALVADIPRIRIAIGDVNLTLDERYAYTDTQGQSQEVSSSSSTTLEQGTERVFSTSDTNTLANSLTFGQSVTGSYSFPKDFGVEVEASFEQSQSEEYSSTVSQESAQRSNETYNESVERSSGFQSSSEVTREVVDASIQLALDLGSVSDVAFSVTNLEITALWQDPVDPSRLIPVGTLVPAVQLSGGGVPTYNLGPFVPTIGPIVFENREVFPKSVEQLMRSPRGLVFKVANYDIQDEQGRNFAFSSQATYDRTAGIVVDFGNGEVLRSRVSTLSGRVAPFDDTNGDGRIDAAIDCFDTEPGTFDDDNGDGLDDDSCDNDGSGVIDDDDRIVFDANGTTTGRTMQNAMAILGLSYVTEDVSYDSYPGLEVVTSVEGIANGADPADNNAWVLFVSRSVGGGFTGGEVVADTDFDDLVLHGGDTYTLAYLQDDDQDQLFNREEYLHGSSDAWTNSDDGTGSNDTTCPSGEGYAFSYFQDNPSATLPLPAPNYTCDTLTDWEEIRVGWLVTVRGETQYRAYASPRRVDSDSDFLADHLERELGTDASRRDTDQDGLSDFDEVYGFKIRFRGELSFGDFTDKFCLSASGSTCLSTALWVTDPLDPDTDGDGLQDGFELGIGANPQQDDAADFIDTDQDGLPDSKEEFGFDIVVNGVTQTVFSSKYEPDTDADGLPDLLEYLVGSDPQYANTDRDPEGLTDYAELDVETFGAKIDSSFDLNEFLTICGNSTYNAGRCSYDAAASPQYGTDPSETDTDADGLSDNDELFEEWTISVTGAAPYTVQSDPTDHNSDNDAWSDGFEVRTSGTDPTKGDTDGDTVLDSDEGSKCVGTTCQNPLTPDQKIQVTYTEIEFYADSEPASAEPGDFYWTLSVILPGGVSKNVSDVSYFGVDDDDFDASLIKRIDSSLSFIKAHSESFSLDVNFGEDDGAGTGEDDCVLDTSTPYSGQIGNTNPTFDSSGCATIRATIRVL